MISLAATILTASLAFAQSATTPADTSYDTPAAKTDSAAPADSTTPGVNDSSATAPADTNTMNENTGTTDTATGAGSTTMSENPDTVGTSTATTTPSDTTAAATTADDDRGIGSTLAWLIPLLIVIALAVPFVRRWNANRRREVPVGGRM